MNENLSTDAPLDTLLHHWPGILFRQRADFTFAFLSPGAAGLTGVSPERWRAEPELFWQLVHEADADAVRRRLEECAAAPGGVTGAFRARHLRTGRVTHCSEFRRAILDAGGRVVCYEGVWTDITRDVARERRLSAGAWHETLASLAMGMAHDFNNVMAGVLSLSEFFLGQTDARHPFHEGLGLIRQNTRQAAQTVQRVVGLYQGKPGGRTYHDLNEVAADTFALLRKLALRRVEPILQLAPEKLPVHADAVELRQALIQLVLSAGQMVAERSRLALATARERDGAGVRLSVAAGGFVVPPEQAAALGDPFAAASPVSPATAARLRAVKFFAERHHGALSFEPAEGGTLLRLRLPEADFTEVERADAQARSRPPRVLLAGRDDAALDARSEALRRAGLRTVIGGTDAAALLASEDDAFDALLVLAPDGAEEWLPLLRFARRRTPPVRTVLQTAAAGRDETQAEWAGEVDLLAPEELTGPALAEKLRAIL